MFADKCIAGLKANREKCEQQIEWSMSMATSLAPKIGYDRAARIAKQAVAEGKTVRRVCLEEHVLPESALDDLLNPVHMLRGKGS